MLASARRACSRPLRVAVVQDAIGTWHVFFTRVDTNGDRGPALATSTTDGC